MSSAYYVFNITQQHIPNWLIFWVFPNNKLHSLKSNGAFVAAVNILSFIYFSEFGFSKLFNKTNWTSVDVKQSSSSFYIIL